MIVDKTVSEPMRHVMTELESDGVLAMNRVNLDELKEGSMWGYDIYFCGDGSSGFVYMFESRDRSECFALKVAHVNTTDQEAFNEKLFDGEMLRELSFYPQIVDVYGYGDYWVMMEYVSGHSFYDELGYTDDDMEDRVLDVMEGVGELMREVYDVEGIYMFDVHADNVLVDGKGNFKIVDAGMFREVTTPDDDEREYLVKSWRESILDV